MWAEVHALWEFLSRSWSEALFLASIRELSILAFYVDVSPGCLLAFHVRTILSGTYKPWNCHVSWTGLYLLSLKQLCTFSSIALQCCLVEKQLNVKIVDVEYTSQRCSSKNYLEKQSNSLKNNGHSVSNILNPYPAVHDNPYLCKQCWSRSDGFWRSHLIRIYTVCHSVCEFERKHSMM